MEPESPKTAENESFLTTVESDEKIVKTTESPKEQLSQEENTYLTIKLGKKRKFRICKNLLPVRLAQIFWYGGGRLQIMYCSVYMKQKNLPLSHFASTYSISFVFEFFMIFLSGIVADRIGNAKPVYIFHLFLNMAITLCMIFAPQLNSNTCNKSIFELFCSYPMPNDTFPMLNVSNTTFSNYKCSESNAIKLLDSKQHSTFFDNLESVCPGYESDNLNICTVRCSGIYESDLSNVVETTDFNETCSYYHLSNSFEEFHSSNQTLYVLCCLNTYRHDHSNVSEHLNSSIDYTSNAQNITRELHSNRLTLWGCCYKKALERECNADEDTYLLLYTILLIMFVASLGTCFRFTDITVMTMAAKHGSNLGYERMFSTGDIFILFFGGSFVKTSSSAEFKNNYDNVYWIAFGSTVLATLLVCQMAPYTKPPARNIMKEVWKLIQNPDIAIFIFTLVILGSSFNVYRTYTVWFFDYLKADKILFSLLPLCGSLYSLPMLFTSKWWIQKLGTYCIFLFAFIAYAIYGISVSFIHNPWWVLLVLSTQTFSFHLMWVTSVVYSHHIAPEELISTVIALAGVIHFAIGRSIGIFLGGLGINSFGPRVAFQMLSGICLISGIIFCLLVCIRRKCTTHSPVINVDPEETSKK